MGNEGLDFVVGGGIRVAEPSTVVDMVGRYPKILRQGNVGHYQHHFGSVCANKSSYKSLEGT